MRLSYILLVVAATLALEVRGATLSKTSRVDPVNDHEIMGNNPRILRAQKKDHGVDEEERMFLRMKASLEQASEKLSAWGKATETAKKFKNAQSFNSRTKIIKEVKDEEPYLKKLFPDYDDKMSLEKFTDMVVRSNVENDEKAFAILAFTRYKESVRPSNVVT
ncbi:hypothetical protein PPTG_14260 [Phytophthora nicotianae INRA-310]|uniref:RxLR effector protein n=1 Tax=Phytophthora nicotianae (strain INRA-310) TaxID=761204 RepID=W2PY18_PHYN3|nr:hypothetical protein PPTG_14260 [Phytophthora nicotianae INRA-310]ETN05551.1 hypothetical protein PPTG_14260 [Phytophthora nicotianae INRA-310]